MEKEEAAESDINEIDIDKKIEENQKAKYGYHSPKEDSDEEDTPQDERTDSRYTLIHKKKDRPDANLDDFELKKMVGKGTFGKVYLVQ